MMSAITSTPAGDAGIADFEERYRSDIRTRRLATLGYAALFVAALIASSIVSEFDLGRLANGLPTAWNYIHGTFPTLRLESLGSDLGEWYWGFYRWVALLAETVLMGFVGTALGGAAALLLCFPASRNLVSNAVLCFVCRRLLEIARTVPELVYALIFVYAFGLGPFAGVLALAMHTAGTLGKLFSEVNENVDPRPIEGVQAAGGTWAMVMRLAVLPQVLPNFASYGLLRFEINVRSASVIGIVGAGGIGEELYLSVRQFEYPDISAILLLLIIAVAIIDISCEAIRHRLIGREGMEAA